VKAQVHQPHAKRAKDKAGSPLGREKNGPGAHDLLDKILDGFIAKAFHQAAVLRYDCLDRFLEINLVSF
jgi:hypothetical protein